MVAVRQVECRLRTANGGGHRADFMRYVATVPSSREEIIVVRHGVWLAGSIALPSQRRPRRLQLLRTAGHRYD